MRTEGTGYQIEFHNGHWELRFNFSDGRFMVLDRGTKQDCQSALDSRSDDGDCQ